MNSIKLTIAEPCHKDWATMLPDEQGHFCSSCNKSVIDFTVMDDREIYTTLLKGSADTCGRLTQQQLDGVIKYEAVKRQRWHKYFFSFLVPAFLLVKQAGAQKIIGKLRANTTTAVCNKMTMGEVSIQPIQKHLEFSGIVVDAINKEMIIGATIQIKDGNTGVLTDSTGNFELRTKTGAQTITILISAVGYESKEITLAVPVTDFKLTDEVIVLNRAAKLLGEVVLKSDDRYGRKGNMGMIMIVTRYTHFNNRIVTALNDSLKIFPNPVEHGNTFTAALKLKQTGAYVLQVVDVTGRLIWQQQINIASKIHNQNIECNAAWISGIYFLRVIGNGNKVISTSKFLMK